LAIALVLGCSRHEPAGAPAQPTVTEKSLVAAILHGAPPPRSDPSFVHAVQGINAAHGRLSFDAQGNLALVDLAGGRVSVGDAEVGDLSALTRIHVLRLAGQGLTSRAVDTIVRMAALSELMLQDARLPTPISSAWPPCRNSCRSRCAAAPE
jgi:hypothetical protein